MCETGDSTPELEKLVELARVFGVSLDELAGMERGQEGEQPGREAAAPPRMDWRWRFEYKSRRTLFGLPLVHINVGRGVFYRAKGIIAIGAIAKGVVAIGLVSLGGLAIGAASVGVLAAGAVALGGCAAGAVAVGGIAVGSIAVGKVAVGSLAVGEITHGALEI